MSSISAAERHPRSFRPGRALTALALLGFVLLLSLGTWQVQRMGWKHALIASIEAGMALPSLVVDAGVDPATIPEYRRVSVSGRFLAGRVAFLGVTTADGAPGTDLVAFLGDPQGRVWPVDRGWIPATAMSAPPEARDGIVALTAVLRDLPRPGLFTPADDLAGRRLYAPSAGTLTAIAGQPVVPRLLVALPLPGQPAAAEEPRPAQVRIDLPDSHLGYAITWYGLAAALLVFYVLMGFQRGSAAG